MSVTLKHRWFSALECCECCSLQRLQGKAQVCEGSLNLLEVSGKQTKPSRKETAKPVPQVSRDVFGCSKASDKVTEIKEQIKVRLGPKSQLLPKP